MHLKFFTISLCLLVVTLLPITTNADYIEAPIRTVENYSVTEMIDKAAKQFNQDPKLISKISYCESGHKVLPHDGGRAVNMTGIHDSTFRGWLTSYQKETGETLDITSVYDQFKMMSWAFSKGESYRNQWSTYRAYKRGGEYTFYSRLLGATFTARCK